VIILIVNLYVSECSCFIVSCYSVADAFVNSQEWTVSRRLNDIRLVIIHVLIFFCVSVVIIHFLLTKSFCILEMFMQLLRNIAGVMLTLFRVFLAVKAVENQLWCIDT